MHLKGVLLRNESHLTVSAKLSINIKNISKTLLKIYLFVIAIFSG